MRFLIETASKSRCRSGPSNGSSIVDAQLNPIEQHLIPGICRATQYRILDEFGVTSGCSPNEQCSTRSGDGAVRPA